MWSKWNYSSCFTLVLVWGSWRDGHSCLQWDPTPVVELEDEVPGPGDTILTWWINTLHIKYFTVSTRQLEKLKNSTSVIINSIMTMESLKLRDWVLIDGILQLIDTQSIIGCSLLNAKSLTFTPTNFYYSNFVFPWHGFNLKEVTIRV